MSYGSLYQEQIDEMKGDMEAAEARIIELEDFAHEVISMLPETHPLRVQAEKFFEGRKPESWTAMCLRYVRRDIKNYAEAIEFEVKQRYAPPPEPETDELPF